MALHQPNIDPVIFNIYGPLQLRWYSVLYVGGFVVGGWLLKKLSKEDRFLFTAEQVEKLIMWLLIGAVVGARVFYCVVYDPQMLLENPLYLFQTYRGGLSFHGGLLGVIGVAVIFSRTQKIPLWNIADALCLVVPIGLGLGRIGNFINGELWGRPADVPWAMIFRQDPTQLPRHPSQVYELLLEGIVLFCILWGSKKFLKKDGQITFLFMFCYTACRFIVEFFREPDPHIGYLTLGLSMGQWLSVLMLAITGVAYLRYNKRMT